MNIRHGRYQYSIFLKLLIGLIIVIIPLYLLGLFINISGANDIKNEISKSTSEQIYNYLADLESEIGRIIIVQREYLNDTYLLRLSIMAETMSDYGKIQDIKNIMSHIQMLKTLSPYVENVNVHIPLIERTISINNSIENLKTDELEGLGSYSSLYGSPIICWDKRLFLNVPFVDPKLTFFKEPTFALSVELSQIMMVNDLRKLTTYPESGTLLISEEGGWIIRSEDSMIIDYVKDFIAETNKVSSLEGQGVMKVDKRDYLIVYKKSDFLDCTLLAYIPQSEFLKPLETYRSLSWMLTGLSLVIIVLFAIWEYKLVMQPLDNLINAFGEVEEGNWDVSIHRKNKDEFGYLYEQFNEMVRNIKSLFNQMYEQRIRAQNAELKQLQYQINPHFLYNSIFLIYRMAKLEDYDNIVRLSQHLGTYYQFITRSGKDDISLIDEINHAKDYVEIQTIRFGGRIKVIWEQCEGDYFSVNVPRLIIQPLIENAYCHGLGNKLKDGEIHIKIVMDENHIQIIVEDNGMGMREEDLSNLQERLLTTKGEMETTAILNIHRRLQIRYGNSSGVSVSRSDLGGLRVVISIFYKGGAS